MGYVLISRKLPDGRIAFGAFLLDVFCLGVKNAFPGITPPEDYAEMRESLGSTMELVSIEPACARKLTEGAVAYARDLGLPPHADYRKTQPIFGNVDPSACPHEYAYGKDGKPVFIAGPDDSPARCRRIISVLTDRLGPDRFEYTVPLLDGGVGEWPPFLEEEFDEDDEEF